MNNNIENEIEQEVQENSSPLGKRNKVEGVYIKKNFLIAGLIIVSLISYALVNTLGKNKNNNDVVKDQVQQETEEIKQENPLDLNSDYTKTEENLDEATSSEAIDEVNGNSFYYDENGNNNEKFQNQPLDLANDSSYYQQNQNKDLLQNQNNENRSNLNEAIMEARKSPLSFSQKESQSKGNTNSANNDILAQMIASQQGVGASTIQQETDKYTALNQQKNKSSFSSSVDSSSNNWYLKSGIKEKISNYELKAGSIIPGTLITAINSDLPGQVTAIVRETIYDTITGKHILIVKGTKLIGQYNSVVTFGQNRVMIVWQRLIMPNGDSVDLENMNGVDLTGASGLTGKVDNHFMKMLGGVVLSAMIGAGTDASEDSTNATTYAQESASTIAQGYADKFLNVQPTIKVKQGTKFNIFVNKDMVLRPYGE